MKESEILIWVCQIVSAWRPLTLKSLYVLDVYGLSHCMLREKLNTF